MVQKSMIMIMVKIGGKCWTMMSSSTEGLVENRERPAWAGQSGTGIPGKAAVQARD